MEDEILKFVCWITGHDKDTIHQMWNDYFSSPKAKSIPINAEVIVQGELLPCPFCGSQAAVGGTSFESDGVYIYCTNDNCHVAMGENYDRDGGDDHWYISEKEAIALWNKRVGREPQSE